MCYYVFVRGDIVKISSTSKRLKELMQEQNIKQIQIVELCQPLCKKYNIRIGRNDISQYVNGKVEPSQDRIDLLAEALNVSEAWLMGYDVPKERENANNRVIKFNYPEVNEDYVEYPAGFDKIAIEDWTEDKIKIHPDFLKGREREEFFVLRVKGESMYPMYLDGDKVLVRRQNTVDYSGQIAVVIYGENFGTIKKVEYRKDSIALVPINPQYQPEIINDLDTETFEILGIPALLVREIEE